MIKKYSKDVSYSYTLGFFPTFELLEHQNQYIKNIYLSKSVSEENLNKIKSLIAEDKIIINDDVLEKLAPKENCYALGVFDKYQQTLAINSDHVVLVNPSNMGNLGTIMRSMLGFNLKNLAIIEPACDHFDPKVLRASMGAFASLNIELFPTFADYNKKYPLPYYPFMLQATHKLNEFTFPKSPIALVYGNEATGLPKEFLNDNALIIPHSSNIDSLNLQNAVTISLYTLYLERI